MTEKRYVDIGVEWIDGFIQDHEEDNDLFGIGAVVDCLNEQDKIIQQLQENLDYYRTKCASLETALVQGRRAVDKEKEQRMFLVDMEKERKMFR